MRIPSLEIPDDDLTFVTDLLKQKHVLVVHGSGFGEKPGTRHMRIVFLPPEPVLSAAYDTITDFMKQRYQYRGLVGLKAASFIPQRMRYGAAEGAPFQGC